MARRQVRWAKRALDVLRVSLRGRCNNCGAEQSLEFDCIVPQGHKHHAAGISARACFYRKQARLGNLQLLCEPCHRRKSAAECPGGLLLHEVDSTEYPY